jgi:hypothetical protein
MKGLSHLEAQIHDILEAELLALDDFIERLPF